MYSHLGLFFRRSCQTVAELAHQLHFWLAYTFLALITLHAFEQHKFLGTIWRRLIS